MGPGVSVLGHYKSFKKKIGLSLCFIDMRPPRCMLDGSVQQLTRWTVANVAHLSITQLGGHAHL